ncbi:hypothetical protein FRB94_013152 [Tulasnella sp. JGI-2019a]|nr:hypothetical protein FRB94_013152 [Tulasnella sp. JGI-2019a]
MSSASSHWTKPETRPEMIDQLVEGVDRYNPQNVEILEDYLNHQMRGNEYDCLANLAILKLYQFNPDLYNPDVVINILAKALTVAPAQDFNLCLALTGERATPLPDPTDPFPQLLPQLQYLYTLLRTCKFTQFWATYLSPEVRELRKSYLVQCSGFEQDIREVVVKAVRSTFVRIGRSRLEGWLYLTGEPFDKYIARLGWIIDSKGTTVSIPPNADNQIQATVIREDVQLAQLAKIIAHAQLASA